MPSMVYEMVGLHSTYLCIFILWHSVWLPCFDDVKRCTTRSYKNIENRTIPFLFIHLGRCGTYAWTIVKYDGVKAVFSFYGLQLSSYHRFNYITEIALDFITLLAHSNTKLMVMPIIERENSCDALKQKWHGICNVTVVDEIDIIISSAITMF